MLNKKIEQFIDLFEAENHKLNLCKFENRDHFRSRHVLDCWEASQFLEKTDKVLDIGTGGGLPGMILAIASPETDFTLIDSTQKKCDSVERIRAKLGLKNAHIVAGRAETLAHDPKYRESFDAVTARAVAPLPTLLELAAGFVRPGGLFIAYKGPKYQEELEASKNAMEVLNFELEKIHQYEWTLLIFRKNKSLSNDYPRDNGTPKKKPL